MKIFSRLCKVKMDADTGFNKLYGKLANLNIPETYDLEDRWKFEILRVQIQQHVLHDDLTPIIERFLEQAVKEGNKEIYTQLYEATFIINELYELLPERD